MLDRAVVEFAKNRPKQGLVAKRARVHELDQRGVVLGVGRFDELFQGEISFRPALKGPPEQRGDRVEVPRFELGSKVLSAS